MIIRTSDQMASVKIMITSGHMSKSFSRICHNHFRSLKLCSQNKFPGKFLTVYSHDHTNRVKLCQFCLRDKISGINKMHGIHSSLFLCRSRCHKCQEWMFLMAGLPSCRRNKLFSIMERILLDMAFSCPGAMQ